MYNLCNLSAMSNIFSLEGKVLKLNSADDVKEYVEQISAMENLTEIRLSGNSFGIGAGSHIAASLKSKASLEVKSFCMIIC